MITVKYEKEDLVDVAEEAFVILGQLTEVIENTPMPQRSNKVNMTKCLEGAFNLRPLILKMLEGI